MIVSKYSDCNCTPSVGNQTFRIQDTKPGIFVVFSEAAFSLSRFIAQPRY